MGKRVIYPASHFDVDKASTEVLVERMIASVRASFRRLVARLRRSIPEGGNLDTARIIAEADLAINSFADELEGHTLVAGQQSDTTISREFAPDRPGIRLTFQPSEATVVQAFATNRRRILNALSTQIRQSLSQVIRPLSTVTTSEQGVLQLSSRARSRTEIRQGLLLNDYERSVLSNYRTSLGAGSRDALDRVLRDRRFDRTVQRAVAGDIVLNDAQINRMVDAYGNRLLGHRAETIAITEGVRIANEADELFIRQAFARGDLDPSTTVRAWQTQRDERVRGSHSAMHGQIRALDDPYISGAGNSLRFPGDPIAPRSETIRCRCFISTTVGGTNAN